MGREVHYGKVNVCIGEGRLCQTEEGFELFDRGLFRVLVLVVDAYGKNENFDLRVRGGFFADLEEMVDVSSGVAVQLDVGVVMAWDALDVGVSQYQDWFFSLERPVLDFAGGACNMVVGPVESEIGKIGG